MEVVYSILLIMTFLAWGLLLLSVPITFYEFFVQKRTEESNYTKSMMATLGLCLWSVALFEILKIKNYTIFLPFFS